MASETRISPKSIRSWWPGRLESSEGTRLARSSCRRCATGLDLPSAEANVVPALEVLPYDIGIAAVPGKPLGKPRLHPVQRPPTAAGEG